MKRMLAAIVGATVAVGASALLGRKVPDPRMVGAWEGDARIYVDWTVQKQLPVRLVVAPDGSVEGRIGDARLVGGHLRRNRGQVGRLLHVKTDYVVRGALDGPVLAAEDVRRDGVSLPLDWSGEAFRGAVHTSGSKFGGKERMILTAGQLELRRAPTAPTGP